MLGDFHAFEQLVGRFSADGRFDICDAAEFVVIVLEQVRIDGADRQSEARRVRFQSS